MKAFTGSRRIRLSHPAWSMLVLLTLALIKLWLIWDAPLVAMPHSLHDDHLFVRLAHSISHGEWLGGYDHLTLIKGPFYPLWIASISALGLPLLVAQHVAYLGACCTLLVALRPILGSRVLALSLFALLLFDPMTFLAQWCRVTRQGIYTTLSLLVLSMAIGLAVRARRRPLRLMPWSLGLGLFLGAFWLTREEGVWLLPSTALLLFFCIYVGWQRRHRFAELLLVYVGVPLALLLISIATVAEINHSYYGVRQVVDLKSPAFLSAFGALQRPISRVYDRRYPVPEDVRMQLYASSPAFTELKGYLEGPRGEMWKSRDSGHSDFKGGPMMWALREATRAAGHHQSAVEADRYYQRLADEVNGACRSGRLQCTPERASLAPRFDRRLLWPVMQSTYRAARFLVDFEKSDRQGKPVSRGTPRDLAFFSGITRGRVQTLDRRSRPRSADGYDAKMPMFVAIAGVYQGIIKWLLLASLVGYAVESASVLRSGRIRSGWVILSSLLVAIAIRLIILGIIEETSFTAIRTKYIAPADALLLIFVVLGVACGWARNEEDSDSMSGSDANA